MKYLLSLFCVVLFIQPIFSQIESKLYLENATITSIKEDKDYLWVSTYGYGVFRYSKKDDSWFNFSTKNKNFGNDLLYSLAVSDRYMWAGSDDGLYIYDRKEDTWKQRKFAVGGQWGNWIRSLCYDSTRNVLWIGRFIDLTRLDVASNKYKDINLTEDANPRTNDIKTISMDGDSSIWFGTESGVHIYDERKDIDDKSAWTFIDNKNGFNGDGDAVSISGILFEGKNAWISTDEFITPQQPNFNIGGIYIYDRAKTWLEIYNQNGLPTNGVYCMQKSGNKIWAGIYSFDGREKKDYGKGIVLIDRFNDMVTPIDLDKLNINSSKVLCMHFDGKNIWLGTEKGLVKLVLYNPLAEFTLKKIKKVNNRIIPMKKLKSKKKGKPSKQIKDVKGESSW
jgi:ligand-binding sensor domain-containing protein